MASVMDPSDPDVRAEAARSREILVELGATPFVERVDTALSRPPRERMEVSAMAESDDRTRV